MKLGVFTVLFAEKNFEEMLDHVASAGLKAVEIGTGAYPGNAHCSLNELLESKELRADYLKRFYQEVLKSAHSAAMAIRFPLIEHLQRNRTACYMTRLG